MGCAAGSGDKRAAHSQGALVCPSVIPRTELLQVGGRDDAGLTLEQIPGNAAKAVKHAARGRRGASTEREEPAWWHETTPASRGQQAVRVYRSPSGGDQQPGQATKRQRYR